MKRLIRVKKAVSKFMFNTGLDKKQAIDAIKAEDFTFNEDNLCKDFDDVAALWGCIDDSKEYISEVYVYTKELNTNDKKAAYVTGDLNGNVIEVQIKEVSGNLDAVNELKINGITLRNGEAITFKDLNNKES